MINWPWHNAAAEVARREAQDLAEQNRVLRSELDIAQDAVGRENQRYIHAETEVIRLQRILAQCHYRDPKTGRIGKKGARR